MTNNVFGTIRGEIDDFINNSIEVVPGYLFNQYDTIRRCHLYLNSRFLNSSCYQNKEKIFYNIVKYRRDIAAKFLNIDTKDIRLWELNPESKWSTFLFEKELKLWMKKNKMGKLLNDMAVESPSFGSVVIRKTKNSATMVDLRRLFLDPTVETIQKSRFITIKHYFTATELREKIKDGWDEKTVEYMIEERENANNKSNAPKSYEKNSMDNIIRSSPYFEIYERFGEVHESHLGGRGNKMVRSLFIVYNPFDIMMDEQGNYKGENGSVLFKSKWNKPYPFKDYHYTKTMGRWLGIGVVEDLFEAQERRNELANQKRISMEISTIHLFQTPGKNLVNNIMSDLVSGDLIQTGPDGEIKPIANEERNLNAFNSEEIQYDMLADKLSFATAQASGEALPASTPATNAVIQQNNTNSLFGFKRENFALFIQEFFVDFVLDNVFKNLTDEHILRYAGTPDEIQKLDQGYIDVLTKEFIINNVLKNGVVPSPEEIQLTVQNYAFVLKKEGGTRFVNVKENFYKDISFEFDIMVGAEQENVAIMANNLFQVLTAVAQNPMILENPITKTLIFEYAQKIGINPMKLELAQNQQAQQVQQAPQGSPQAPQGATQPPVGQNATAPARVQ